VNLTVKDDSIAFVRDVLAEGGGHPARGQAVSRGGHGGLPGYDGLDGASIL
jgi:hypothetical protein